MFIYLQKQQQPQQSKQMRHEWDQVIIVIRRALTAFYIAILINDGDTIIMIEKINKCI